MPAKGNRLFKFYSHWTENFLNGLIAETVPFLYTFELSYKWTSFIWCQHMNKGHFNREYTEQVWDWKTTWDNICEGDSGSLMRLLFGSTVKELSVRLSKSYYCGEDSLLWILSRAESQQCVQKGSQAPGNGAHSLIWPQDTSSIHQNASCSNLSGGVMGHF